MKTIVITGATSGIGYAVCRAFLQKHWAVLGVGRNETTCDAAAKKLLLEFPDADLRFFPCDLSKQAEILRLGEVLLRELNDRFGGKLDALVNNAGCVRSYYTTTEDGYETVFVVNHLAAFLLTKQLMPPLIAAGGRVLITSSQSHLGIKIRWDDVMLSRRYRPLFAYKQSKLCNLLFAFALNCRFTERGVSCAGIDPGLVHTNIGEKQTSGIVSLFWRFRKRGGVPPETAAKTYVHALADGSVHALYYGQCKPQRYSRQVNAENADRLWELSERLCGTEFA